MSSPTNGDGPPPWWLALAASMIRRLPIGRYRAVHAVGSRVRRRFVARVPGIGALCRIDLQDSIARDAYLAGSYEPLETRLVQRLVDPGATVVDVGANWGYHSLLAAARVGPGGRVICCEPHPALVQALTNNLALNGFHWATVVPVAVGATAGLVRLETFDPAGGNSGISRVVPSASATTRVVDVPARPLDDILAQYAVRSVDLLKVDVEGAEGLVLAGAHRTLAGGRVRRLLLEVHPLELRQHGHSTAQLMRNLVAHGLRGWNLAAAEGQRRLAAYRRSVPVRAFLTPIEPDQPLGDWPHQLWLAPGVEIPK